MRRLLAGVVPAVLALAPLTAWAQRAVPTVDLVEITGVIDRPIARYALERLEAAERNRIALLVFQIDSGGAIKIAGSDLVPELIRRVRDARVPVGVYVGPRTARAAGAAVFLAAAAHLSAIDASARLGPAHPIDLARRDRSRAAETAALRELAGARGRRPTGSTAGNYGANESLRLGFVDAVVPSGAEFLRWADGRTVTTALGPVRLSLPGRGVDVRFTQPGPIRRAAHTLANPTLVYLLILGGAMLIVFELFQPGFGVAGVTGGLLLAGAAYGLTVLPVRWGGFALLAGGLVLLAIDVALDRLGVATVLGAAALAAGSLTFLPPGLEALRVPRWLVGAGVASALVMFVPVMTVVRRARVPVAAQARRHLVGEGGEVRSVLNPEGFVLVDGELWRARSKSGARMRVGEPVVVASVEGTVLVVRASP